MLLLAEVEEKSAIRRVRTPQGVNKFKQPIGSLIVGKTRLTAMLLHAPVYRGYDRVERIDAKKRNPRTGEMYDLGRKADGPGWAAYHADTHDVVFEAPTEEALFVGLNDKWGGADVAGVGGSGAPKARLSANTRSEIGLMLGGWSNQLIDEGSPIAGEFQEILDNYDDGHTPNAHNDERTTRALLRELVEHRATGDDEDTVNTAINELTDLGKLPKRSTYEEDQDYAVSFHARRQSGPKATTAEIGLAEEAVRRAKERVAKTKPRTVARQSAQTGLERALNRLEKLTGRRDVAEPATPSMPKQPPERFGKYKPEAGLAAGMTAMLVDLDAAFHDEMTASSIGGVKSPIDQLRNLVANYRNGDINFAEFNEGIGHYAIGHSEQAHYKLLMQHVHSLRKLAGVPDVATPAEIDRSKMSLADRITALAHWTKPGPDYNRRVVESIDRATNLFGKGNQEGAYASIIEAEIAAGLRPESDWQKRYEIAKQELGGKLKAAPAKQSELGTLLDSLHKNIDYREAYTDVGRIAQQVTKGTVTDDEVADLIGDVARKYSADPKLQMLLLRAAEKIRADNKSSDEKVDLARARQERLDVLRHQAEYLSRVEEIMMNGGSLRALMHERDRVNGPQHELLQPMRAAMGTGEYTHTKNELDKAALALGMTRIGADTPFDPHIHAPVGRDSSIKRGTKVRLVSPGYMSTNEFEAFTDEPRHVVLVKARVEALRPGEEQTSSDLRTLEYRLSTAGYLAMHALKKEGNDYEVPLQTVREEWFGGYTDAEVAETIRALAAHPGITVSRSGIQFDPKVLKDLQQGRVGKAPKGGTALNIPVTPEETAALEAAGLPRQPDGTILVPPEVSKRVAQEELNRRSVNNLAPIPGVHEVDPDYEGWKQYEDSEGYVLYFGQDEDDKRWYVTGPGGWDEVWAEGDTPQQAWDGLREWYAPEEDYTQEILDELKKGHSFADLKQVLSGNSRDDLKAAADALNLQYPKNATKASLLKMLFYHTRDENLISGIRKLAEGTTPEERHGPGDIKLSADQAAVIAAYVKATDNGEGFHGSNIIGMAAMHEALRRQGLSDARIKKAIREVALMRGANLMESPDWSTKPEDRANAVMMGNQPNNTLQIDPGALAIFRTGWVPRPEAAASSVGNTVGERGTTMDKALERIAGPDGIKPEYSAVFLTTRADLDRGQIDNNVASTLLDDYGRQLLRQDAPDAKRAGEVYRALATEVKKPGSGKPVKTPQATAQADTDKAVQRVTGYASILDRMRQAEYPGTTPAQRMKKFRAELDAALAIHGASTRADDRKLLEAARKLDTPEAALERMKLYGLGLGLIGDETGGVSLRRGQSTIPVTTRAKPPTPEPTRKPLSETDSPERRWLLGGGGVSTGVTGVSVGAQTDAPSTGKPKVSGQLSSVAPITNTWGVGGGEVSYHPDGWIGTALQFMGTDRRMEIDGDSLENVLGKLVTQSIRGQISTEQLVQRTREIRDRLPEGSKARSQLDTAVRRLEAPQTPMPELPAGVPARIRQLMDQLHAIPMVRKEPKEEEALLKALEDTWDAEKEGWRGMRLAQEIRIHVLNNRHESQEGKFELDRAAMDTIKWIDEVYRRHKGVIPRESTPKIVESAPADPDRPNAGDDLELRWRQVRIGNLQAKIQAIGVSMWPLANRVGKLKDDLANGRSIAEIVAHLRTFKGINASVDKGIDQLIRELEGEVPKFKDMWFELIETKGDYMPGLTAEQAKHKGAMVALIPRQEDIDRLYIPGGEPKDELHVTLYYLGKGDDYNQTERALIIEKMREVGKYSGYGLMKGDGFSINLFNPQGDEPCMVLGISGNNLDNLHRDVVYALERVGEAEPPAPKGSYNGGANWDIMAKYPGQHSPWIPHITLAYYRDGAPLPDTSKYAGKTGPVRFDRLRVVFAGEATDIPLTMNNEEITQVLHEVQHMLGKSWVQEQKAPTITPGGRVGDDARHGSRANGENWVERTSFGSLPRYIRIVRNGLMKHGHSESRATALAVAAIKRWARGGDHVTPKVQAAAAKALAQWEAMKAEKSVLRAISLVYGGGER